MAIQMERLEELLRETEWRYRIDDDRIRLGFNTKNYVDGRDGHKSIGLVIHLHEDGEFVRIDAPWAFKLPIDQTIEDRQRRVAFFEVMARIANEYKMVRLGYDPNDGEIRASTEIPLEDGELTVTQLDRLVSAIPGMLDEYYFCFRTALLFGRVDMTLTYSNDTEDEAAILTPMSHALRLISCSHPADVEARLVANEILALEDLQEADLAELAKRTDLSPGLLQALLAIANSLPDDSDDDRPIDEMFDGPDDADEQEDSVEPDEPDDQEDPDS